MMTDVQRLALGRVSYCDPIDMEPYYTPTNDEECDQ